MNKYNYFFKLLVVGLFLGLAPQFVFSMAVVEPGSDADAATSSTAPVADTSVAGQPAPVAVAPALPAITPVVNVLSEPQTMVKAASTLAERIPYYRIDQQVVVEDVELKPRFQKIKILDGIAQRFNDYPTWIPEYKLPIAGKGAVVFTAKANAEICVAFSRIPGRQTPMYEIVLGTDDQSDLPADYIDNAAWAVQVNKMAVIHRDGLVASSNSTITDPGPKSLYWAMVNSDEKKISMGAGSIPGQNVLIEYVDPDFLSDVQYFNFTARRFPVTYSSISVVVSGLGDPGVQPSLLHVGLTKQQLIDAQSAPAPAPSRRAAAHA